MTETLNLIPPTFIPPLDPGFRPTVLTNRNYLKEVDESGSGEQLMLGLERPDGSCSRFQTRVFSPSHPKAGANLLYAERLMKFLLWQKGGCRVYVGGPREVGEHLARTYSPNGNRSFDHRFMGEEVYGQPFEVFPCDVKDVPPDHEISVRLGGHLDGCRIGFDLGASDRKVSAVKDGKPVFSEEVVWEPVKQTDPEYHYREICAGLRRAAAHLPRVDAIGGSAAGIYINNRVRVASLFRGVPKESYDSIRNLFLRIGDEFRVPLDVVNDGEVTALAGALSLEDNGVLGLAFGSSEAGGYVGLNGCITNWLNELAFAPVDYSPEAPKDEWSGDRGVGASYFSQQAVFRLAGSAGIDLPTGETNARKLEIAQEALENGHAGALKIWQSMGIYLGYTLAHYADYYDLKHVLIMGRCTSGTGGQVIIDLARQVLVNEFPELARRINVQLPDEKSRRVGQSIAAASLPEIRR